MRAKKQGVNVMNLKISRLVTKKVSGDFKTAKSKAAEDSRPPSAVSLVNVGSAVVVLRRTGTPKPVGARGALCARAGLGLLLISSFLVMSQSAFAAESAATTDKAATASSDDETKAWKDVQKALRP